MNPNVDSRGLSRISNERGRERKGNSVCRARFESESFVDEMERERSGHSGEGMSERERETKFGKGDLLLICEFRRRTEIVSIIRGVSIKLPPRSSPCIRNSEPQPKGSINSYTLSQYRP